MPAETAKMPNNVEWDWNETHVDIVLKDPKNDISSLIPILINMSSDLIRKSDFKGAKQKCDKARIFWFLRS